MKTIKALLLALFFVVAITACREQTPQADDEQPPVEIIEADELEIIVTKMVDIFDAELIEEPTYSEFLISYSFLLPIEMGNIIVVRTAAILVFNQFGYDITQKWFVDSDGNHYTEFSYKRSTLKLIFDPSTNIFCIEITRF